MLTVKINGERIEQCGSFTDKKKMQYNVSIPEELKDAHIHIVINEVNGGGATLNYNEASNRQIKEEA